MSKFLSGAALLLSPFWLMAKECRPFEGKIVQYAHFVELEGEDGEDGVMYHVGYYLGAKVVTVWEGIGRGHQVIFCKDNKISVSDDWKVGDGGMWHIHERDNGPFYVIFSSEEKQVITAIGRGKNK